MNNLKYLPYSEVGCHLIAVILLSCVEYLPKKYGSNSSLKILFISSILQIDISPFK